MSRASNWVQGCVAFKLEKEKGTVAEILSLSSKTHKSRSALLLRTREGEMLNLFRLNFLTQFLVNPQLRGCSTLTSTDKAAFNMKALMMCLPQNQP